MDNLMFPPSQLTSLGIGIGIALAILILVRKNHLMVRHGIWWLVVALASIAFGAYPRLIDQVGAVLGIHYPPTLLIVIGMGLILIKMLTIDLKRSDQERQIRALTQRLAILESEISSPDTSHREAASESSRDTVDVSLHEVDATAQDEGVQAEVSRQI
jgi:hypothetical protein